MVWLYCSPDPYNPSPVEKVVVWLFCLPNPSNPSLAVKVVWFAAMRGKRGDICLFIFSQNMHLYAPPFPLYAVFCTLCKSSVCWPFVKVPSTPPPPLSDCLEDVASFCSAKFCRISTFRSPKHEFANSILCSIMA